MSFNLKGICSNLLPGGTYKVVIDSVDFQIGAGGVKTKNLQVRGVISGGTFDKRTFSDVISEKAFSFRLQPFVTAIGGDMNREFATEAEMFTYLFKIAKGKTVMATLEIRTYNGKEYNNVKDYTPLPSSTVSTEDVLKDFGIEAENHFETKPEMKEGFPTVEEASDEDIPF